MRGKKSMLLLFMFLISLSLVYACKSDVGCDDGFACDENGECVEYCVFGETECSDGIDNDGDGLIDFLGACFDDHDGDGVYEELYDCTDKLTAEECKLSCEELPYTDFDPECRSPYDTDESSDPQCADGIDNDLRPGIRSDGKDYPYDPNCKSPEDVSEVTISYAAPELGFLGRLFDALVFWN